MHLKTILFYNDSEVFGGHEIMTYRIMNSLAANPDMRVAGLCHATGFKSHLAPEIELRGLPFHTKTLSPFMPGGLNSQIGHIRQQIADIAPDLLVVSQGYAESGVRGLLAGLRGGVRTCSYIPFGNNNTELNNRFALPRDLLCKLIYRLPGAYITISPYQARLLARFTRADQAIHVIGNPADFDFAPPEGEVRFPDDGPLEIAVVGRLVFKQKNQGVLVPLVQALAGRRAVRIHVVGDGPDREQLAGEIRAAGLEETIILHGWMQKPQLVPFLSEQVDLLLIPSLYEGLPLILLETLHLNKPFLISDLGLLEDYPVPAEWRFDPRQPRQIAERILALGASFDRVAYRRLRDEVTARHGMDRFRADLARVFDDLLAWARDHRRS
jgi:glycosyltransferase involved in cell wall biosynthesis